MLPDLLTNVGIICELSVNQTSLFSISLQLKKKDSSSKSEVVSVQVNFIFCSVYLLLGMALIAMCFNLMQVCVPGELKKYKKSCLFQNKNFNFELKLRTDFSSPHLFWMPVDRCDVVVSGTSHLQINQPEKMCQPVFQVQKVIKGRATPERKKMFVMLEQNVRFCVFFNKMKTRNTNLNLIIFKYAEDGEKKENVVVGREKRCRMMNKALNIPWKTSN